MSAVLQETETRILPFEEWMTEQVLALAREMHAESASHSDMLLDEEKVIAQLRISAKNPDVYVRFAVLGDEVLGGFFGLVTAVFFSRELAARDMAWFVKKTRRGSVAAVRLVKDFEEWAAAKGVRKFFLGQSTGVNVEATKMLYEKLGYTVVGVNTVKVA